MYTLYYSPGAASLIVHLMLIELGAEHTLRRLDTAAGEHKRPEYLALNPSGLIPTLMVDGQPVTEAAALLSLLTERHPDGGLAPAIGSPTRAAWWQWTMFLANTLQPALRQWFYPEDVAPAGPPEAVKESVARRVEGMFAQIDRHLQGRPYVLGDRLSSVDLYLTMLMRWSRYVPKPATDWPELRRLAIEVTSRPSWKAVYEREGLSEWYPE